MVKVQRIGKDGKMHDYWQFTEVEIAKMKELAEKKKQDAAAVDAQQDS